jgi:hydrogenase/urease accessory protein HupE
MTQIRRVISHQWSVISRRPLANPGGSLLPDHRPPFTGCWALIAGRWLFPVISVRSCLNLFLLLCSSSAFAHEVRPAYLELRQTAPETYDALWKVPGQGENLRLGLYVELPTGCTNLTAPRASMINNAFTERWTIRCPGGLSGGTIHIAGLSATLTDVLVRLERLDGTTQVTRLTPSAPSFVVASAADALGVARTYTVLGVEHILSGIDHLLFILALLLITGGGWKLVKTVTAFTVSHSITLTLATLSYIHVPQRPVEATIALSIVFVAAEILRGRQGHVGITARAPWVVAFAFGLMHGLGFASGLSEAGLRDGHIPTALLFFSVGVETGHFLFIGVVMAAIHLCHWSLTTGHWSLKRPRWAPLVLPYAIGSVAMFWVIQRLAAF